MADQHVDVSSVEAGRDVIVAPTQINHLPPSSAARGWTEALLRGPLERTGALQRATHAQEQLDAGKHADAASEFDAVAEALERAGYEPAAESFLQRAASAYALAKDRGAARARYLRLARATVGDGSLDAQSYARRACELSDGDTRWEAEAMLARAAWPERHLNDVALLRTAWKHTAGTATEVEWAAALVELLTLTGDLDQAREVAATARTRHSLAAGDRLALELDYLDLLAPDAADTAWRQVCEWVDDPVQPVDVSATAWQRRGMSLARRGDPDAAYKAFLRAVKEWAREPGYDDQAAEAYFSGLSAHATAGRFATPADGVLPLARAMRGSTQTATSRTERLLRIGLRALINQQFPDAHRFLSVAMATARRAGNLSEFFEAAEALGDCLAATGKNDKDALRTYCLAGVSEKSKEIAKGARVDDILEIVCLEGSSWERRAAWAAVAACKSDISDDAAIDVAQAALAEEARASAEAFPTNAAFYALEALGWIVCAIQRDLREQALAVLRMRLQVGMGDPKYLADPLLMVTVTGLADEYEPLVDALLSGEARVALSGAQIGELLDQRPDQRERLVVAARDGDGSALEALLFANALEGDKRLIDRAVARVRAATSAPVREEKEENGVHTVAYGFGGSLAPEGLMARLCDVGDQEAFVDKVLETLGYDDVPLMTRRGGAQALHNLAAALPASRVDLVIERLVHLAAEEDRPARVDLLDTDVPLARYKINMAPPHALRSSAIDALGAVSSHQPRAIDRLQPSIAPALSSGHEPLVRAALHALIRHPQLVPPDLRFEPFLRSSSPSVRASALSLLSHVQPEAAAAAAALFVADPSEYVRRQLINVAERLSNEQEVLEALARDSNCFVRASALAAIARAWIAPAST